MRGALRNPKMEITLRNSKMERHNMGENPKSNMERNSKTKIERDETQRTI